MSDEPTKEQLANLKRLDTVSDAVSELAVKAGRLFDSGKLTLRRLNELQREATRKVATIGEENMVGWVEPFERYRDEIQRAPQRGELY